LCNVVRRANDLPGAAIADDVRGEWCRGDLLSAGAHAPQRSNHAIHLAVALRVGTDVIVTYDEELVGAGHSAGLAVLSPDADSVDVGRRRAQVKRSDIDRGVVRQDDTPGLPSRSSESGGMMNSLTADNERRRRDSREVRAIFAR
jgi:hypothetical protein